MTEILTLEGRPEAASQDLRERAIATLEHGGVLFLPDLAFSVKDGERPFLDRRVVDEPRKHTGRARVIMEPGSHKLRCTAVRDGAHKRTLQALLERYADWSRDVVTRLIPDYATGLDFGRTSLRPCPRTHRQKLYISAYLATPTQGRRILRVFSNVAPDGSPRGWHFGDIGFGEVARRMAPYLHRERRWQTWPLERAGIIKSRRTPYDDMMRQLRRLTKHNEALQRDLTATPFDFPAGSTWIVCTDGLLHGQLSGNCAFEQTLLVPVTSMSEPERSPLRILEGLLGRTMA